MHRRVTFWIGGNRPIPSIAWLGGVTGISPLRVRRDMMSRSRYAVCASRLRSSKCLEWSRCSDVRFARRKSNPAAVKSLFYPTRYGSAASAPILQSWAKKYLSTHGLFRLVVTPGYIRMLGQRLVKGRDLVESDRPGSEGVAVINEAMVQRFWPGEDPIGKHIRPEFQPTDAPWSVQSTSRWVTVVGVVSNIKEFRLNEEPPPEFYISYRQFASSFMF